MSLQVEKLEHNMAKLTIEVSAEELEGAIQKSYLKQRGKVNVPGFRKGKVPRQVMEKMFGVEVFYEDAANTLIPDAYAKAYDEADIDIVSQPSIEVTQIEKGKPAVFKCTVHEIKAKELPELDDEFASEVSEFDTLEELKADIKAKIKEQKNAEGKSAQQEQALDTIIAATEMDIPDAMVETEARQMVDSFGQRIQQQGLTMQQYMQFTGMDTEKMLEEMRPQAMKRIQTRLVLEAIVAAENIVTSDERLDEEIAKMAEMYSMEADQLKSYMGDAEKEQMKKDIAVEDAVQFILDNAVEK